MSNEVHRLEQEVAKYKDSSDPFHSMKGKSAALQRTVDLARKVCSVKSTVLILGESGVGKEVFAKAIHEASENQMPLSFRLTAVQYQHLYLKVNYSDMNEAPFLVLIVKEKKEK